MTRADWAASWRAAVTTVGGLALALLILAAIRAATTLGGLLFAASTIGAH